MTSTVAEATTAHDSARANLEALKTAVREGDASITAQQLREQEDSARLAGLQLDAARAAQERDDQADRKSRADALRLQAEHGDLAPDLLVQRLKAFEEAAAQFIETAMDRNASIGSITQKLRRLGLANESDELAGVHLGEQDYSPLSASFYLDGTRVSQLLPGPFLLSALDRLPGVYPNAGLTSEAATIAPENVYSRLEQHG